MEKSVDGLVRVGDILDNPHHYSFGAGFEYPQEKSALSKAIKRLRENGFVDFVSDKELILRLTDKGRSHALWTRLKFEDRKWDGKWRMVIWDIPEKRRKARDLLRHQLKQLGFEKIQNSVWASKKDCTLILKEYIKKVGIEDWVKVVESSSISF